ACGRRERVGLDSRVLKRPVGGGDRIAIPATGTEAVTRVFSLSSYGTGLCYHRPWGKLGRIQNASTPPPPGAVAHLELSLFVSQGNRSADLIDAVFCSEFARKHLQDLFLELEATLKALEFQRL